MKKLILGVAASAALMVASSANATFMMSLDDSSTSGVDLVLQDIAELGVLTTGNVTIGTFFVNVTTGVSNPVPGATGTLIDLNSMNVSGGAGTLTIKLTDTDFIRGGAGFLNFQIGGTTDGSISAQAYMDSANTEFGEGTLLGSMTANSGAFAYTSPGTTVNTLDPYSLTLVTTVTHTDGPFKVTSYDANVVPEPSIIALMSLGFIGLGFAGRRKQAK